MNYNQTLHPKECTISQGLSNKSRFVKNRKEFTYVLLNLLISMLY